MATLQERLQADLVNVEEQLVVANTALNDILESQLENYDLEDGVTEARQKAQNLKIDKLQKLIEYLEKKRERLYRSLNGTVRCTSVRLRR